VQDAPGRGRHLLVDRVVHELVAEDDPLVDPVEQLGVVRLAQLPRGLRRRSAGDGGHVAQRHRVAEHGRDPEQLQRRPGEVTEPPVHQVAQ
jgi:hypothetical protein